MESNAAEAPLTHVSKIPVPIGSPVTVRVPVDPLVNTVPSVIVIPVKDPILPAGNQE